MRRPLVAATHRGNNELYMETSVPDAYAFRSFHSFDMSGTRVSCGAGNSIPVGRQEIRKGDVFEFSGPGREEGISLSFLIRSQVL
jgi:hypothetical protein